jgi:hypothetical protein
MKLKILAAAATLCFTTSTSLYAGVSAEEAARLGKDLTPTGAEQAGNADSSIPPWTGGGVENVPAGFDAASGIYPNPFAGDEILYSITKANMAEYADLLSDGQKVMLEKFSDQGYKINVYPSRRTFAAPQWYYDGSKANATGATLEDDGQRIANNVPGVPFPMPQTGLEALWNHMIRWMGYEYSFKSESYYVDSTGRPILASNSVLLWEFPMFMPYHNPDRNYGTKDVRWAFLRSDFEEPARRAGEILLVHEPGADYTAGKGRSAWQYLLGQRRVRKAPAVSFDTPRPASAGTSTYDDAYMYNGSPERFDWKLIGKKEMIVPYNNYEALFEHDNPDILGEKFVNPDVMRYEKHRVWVVEGTLKEGIRHIYSKRRMLIDEDSWHILENGRWDGKGNLWRVGFSLEAMLWDIPAPIGMAEASYDLNQNLYNVTGNPSRGTLRPTTGQSVQYFSPQGMARMGIR